MDESHFRKNGSIWHEICKQGGAENILRELGLLEATLVPTMMDGPNDANNVPVAVVDQKERIAYATQGFESIITKLPGVPVVGREFRDCLQSKNTTVDRLANASCWAMLSSFFGKAELGTTAVLLILCANGNQKLCWNVIHAFPIATPSYGTYVVLVPTVLEAPLPKIISNAVVGVDLVGDVTLLTSMVDAVHRDVRSHVANPTTDTIAVVAQRAENVCKSLAEKLDSAFEGDHFVPMVGHEAAEAFEKLSAWEAVCGEVEHEMKTAWESNDDVFRSTKAGGAKAIACAVADPSSPDCPLVYISPGFEELTQYPRTWALGRNCRFLQPNKRSKNLDLNGDEVKSMKEFTQRVGHTGQILNLLLNEARDGTHFWNLLFMEHVKCAGLGHKKSNYIFAVQTNIVIQKDLLDRLVLDVWESGEGKTNLAQLRAAFQERSSSYSPKETSLLKLGTEVLSIWALEVGRKEHTFWEGASYVPVVGLPAVAQFSGQWPSLVDVAAKAIRSLFKFADATVTSLKDCSDDSVVCSVSDPTSADCPLVYLSRGFENQTGYRNDFALGRNCRFLQPNIPDLNKKLNGDELLRMREFCKQYVSANEGSSIMNLLLNERRNGERFWNLLHMEHVNVDGQPYILGVQTILDMPMPTLLKDANTSAAIWEHDPAMLSGFSDKLAVFLGQIRIQIRATDTACMVEAAKYATDSITNFMKRNCDDYEGDHICPRVGQKEALSFEADKTWRPMLSKLSSILVEIWGVSEYHGEDVACAVSDPNGTDCPLVYVSQKFETMTGYPREWVLGRNCRFLQPNDSRRNANFNEDDKLRMRAFCKEAQPAGTRIINLMVNENKDGNPFWNLLVMEHVDVEGSDYIFGVQTNIEIEASRMAEMLAMDIDGLDQLTRLRGILRLKELNLGKQTLKTIADECLREWARRFPTHLELPRFTVSCGFNRMASSRQPSKSEVASSRQSSKSASYNDEVVLPFASLMLRPGQTLADTLQSGVENGVRHFTFALDNEKCIDDETVGMLLSLQVAELLTRMRQTYLHYVKDALVFSIITRPHLVPAFQNLNSALTSFGYSLECWFLDVRGLCLDKYYPEKVQSKLREAYQTMVTARRAGEVKAIGLHGSVAAIMVAMEFFKDQRQEVPVNVLALDVNPISEMDQSLLIKFQKLYDKDYGSPLMATYNLFGFNDELLNSVALQHRAKAMQMDAPTMLLKWAEARGLVAMVQKVSDSVRGRLEVSADFHRTFTRNYAKAPDCNVVSSEVCVAAECRKVLQEVQAPQRSRSKEAPAPRSARRNSTSVAPARRNSFAGMAQFFASGASVAQTTRASFTRRNSAAIELAAELGELELAGGEEKSARRLVRRASVPSFSGALEAGQRLVSNRRLSLQTRKSVPERTSTAHQSVDINQEHGTAFEPVPPSNPKLLEGFKRPHALVDDQAPTMSLDSDRETAVPSLTSLQDSGSCEDEDEITIRSQQMKMRSKTK